MKNVRINSIRLKPFSLICKLWSQDKALVLAIESGYATQSATLTPNWNCNLYIVGYRSQRFLCTCVLKNWRLYIYRGKGEGGKLNWRTKIQKIININKEKPEENDRAMRNSSISIKEIECFYQLYNLNFTVWEKTFKPLTEVRDKAKGRQFGKRIFIPDQIEGLRNI